MDRRKFLASSAAAVMAANMKVSGAEALTHLASMPNPNGLKVRFLGTGAADWKGRDERGELRRRSSVLLDDRILIDFTSDCFDTLPEGVRPDTIFYTHSHMDHYDVNAAVELGVKYVYLSETWFDKARKEFAAAAAKKGTATPRLIPLCIAAPVVLGDITITPCPADHSTSLLMEQTLIYIVEKNSARVLYATDTACITATAASIIGFSRKSQAPVLTGLVMEATNGVDFELDHRYFSHSSVASVGRTVDVLTRFGALDTGGKPVYLTHLARTLHGTQAELDRTLPSPLKAAFDGLEVVF